ncbi:hypothetical protein [Streptomyces sp. NPDC002467]|uniref:hypothetical protein n=1 Tax=Streptomyces sp. NPDC002467 TaxID=3364647 RepID=UPI0036906492
MLDAIRLGVLDTGFFHGGFPEEAFLTCRFDLAETSAFGGFAAKGDLLCDLGELVFEGMVGVSAHSLARCCWLPLRTKRRRSDGV